MPVYKRLQVAGRLAFLFFGHSVFRKENEGGIIEVYHILEVRMIELIEEKILTNTIEN